MIIWALFLQGVGLGFSAGVSPGPFQAFLLGQTSKRGFWDSLPLAFVPLFSDGPIIALVLLVLTRTPDWFLTLMRLAGGCFLLFLAWGAYLALRHPPADEMGEEPQKKGSFLKGVLINILNPAPYIFWSTITGPLLIRSWEQSPVIAIIFIGTFYLILISCLVVFILLFSLAHRIDRRLTRSLNAISALALLLLGLYQLGEGGTSLMGLHLWG